jgi:CheY-like chemotaxis protein
LGLALSKRLVEGMGGTISVDSSLGSGTVFTVELPAAEAPVHLVKPSDEPAARAATAGEPTVLYIEDNLANLRLIERLLSSSPVRLISAIKGTLGIELAAEHRPDVILLDLHLPDLPGQEVLRRLRADARTSQIPVIVISADAMPSSAVRSMDVAAYLTKPLDVTEFMTVFDSVLAARSVA